jgi:hypothetical protein
MRKERLVQPMARHVYLLMLSPASPPKRHAAINIRPHPDNQHQHIKTQRAAIQLAIYSLLLSYSPAARQHGQTTGRRKPEASVNVWVANWLQMIIVIRHAQSEGNKNRDIHQMIPDHRVKLTEEGKKQVSLPALAANHTNTYKAARQRKQADDYEECSNQTTRSNSSPLPIAVPARPPKASFHP